MQYFNIYMFKMTCMSVIMLLCSRYFCLGLGKYFVLPMKVRYFVNALHSSTNWFQQIRSAGQQNSQFWCRNKSLCLYWFFLCVCLFNCPALLIAFTNNSTHCSSRQQIKLSCNLGRSAHLSVSSHQLMAQPTLYTSSLCYF